MERRTIQQIVDEMNARSKQRPEKVLRPISIDQEMGIAPVAWSWEQWGGMCNAFPYNPGWESRSNRDADANKNWIERGFSEPRPLFLHTRLQELAPQLLAQVKALIHISDATGWEGHACGEIGRAKKLVDEIENAICEVQSQRGKEGF